MATTDNGRRMENRGLLTADDRAFFREKTAKSNPEQARRDKRSNVRKRIERIEEDLELLQAAGEGDLVEEFYARLGRHERLEERLRDLEEKVGDN